MGRMRTAVPLLLVALLCLDGAWALRCHSCTAGAETCSNPVECASHEQACLLEKTVAEFNKKEENSTYVRKKCVSSCMSRPPEARLRTLRAGNLEFLCCATDLCNTAMGRGQRAATTGMMLLAPLLATLLGVFL